MMQYRFHSLSVFYQFQIILIRIIIPLDMHNDSIIQDIDQLQQLLDSPIRSHDQVIHFTSLSFSQDKHSLMEKERTREESYEDIMTQIHQTKLEYNALLKQRQTLRQTTFKQYFNRFYQEFQELKEQNQRLRMQVNRSRSKKIDDKNQRLSNRSSFKAGASAKSIYGDQNNTNRKARRNKVSPNMLIKKNQNSESISNFGRRQMQSPINHKRVQSQLTQRKTNENDRKGSINIMYGEERECESSYKQSMSKQDLLQIREKNIFVQFLERMLSEQRIYECERYSGLDEEMVVKESRNKENDLFFINDLQEEIKQTSDKLQMLTLIMNKYQVEIANMNINLQQIEGIASKLLQVKGRFIQMERKCQKLPVLRRQLNQGQDKITRFTLRNKQKEESSNIPSVETLIKIFTNNPNTNFNVKSSELYSLYARLIREIFKYDTQKQNHRANKLVKVREIIDSLREGRKKFNELIYIYEGRINKLEEKITKINHQHERSEKR